MLSRGSAYTTEAFFIHYDYVEALAAATIHNPADMRKRNAKGVDIYVCNANG